MEEILNQILKVKGVLGILIFNRNGGLIENAGTIGLVSLKKVGSEIAGLFTRDEISGNLPAFLQINYTHRILVILHHPELNLVCICQPEVAAAQLRLTVDVALANLLKDKKLIKTLRKI